MANFRGAEPWWVCFKGEINPAASLPSSSAPPPPPYDTAQSLPRGFALTGGSKYPNPAAPGEARAKSNPSGFRGGFAGDRGRWGSERSGTDRPTQSQLPAGPSSRVRTCREGHGAKHRLILGEKQPGGVPCVPPGLTRAPPRRGCGSAPSTPWTAKRGRAGPGRGRTGTGGLAPGTQGTAAVTDGPEGSGGPGQGRMGGQGPGLGREEAAQPPPHPEHPQSPSASPVLGSEQRSRGWVWIAGPNLPRGQAPCKR